MNKVYLTQEPKVWIVYMKRVNKQKNTACDLKKVRKPRRVYRQNFVLRSNNSGFYIFFLVKSSSLIAKIRLQESIANLSGQSWMHPLQLPPLKDLHSDPAGSQKKLWQAYGIYKWSSQLVHFCICFSYGKDLSQAAIFPSVLLLRGYVQPKFEKNVLQSPARNHFLRQKETFFW